MDYMNLPQILAEFKKLRSLSYSVVSAEQRKPIDQAIESLESYEIDQQGRRNETKDKGE